MTGTEWGTFSKVCEIRFKRGGVWRTYGKAINVGSAAVAGYFTGGTGAVAGGAAAEAIGSTLSNEFGNKSWEVKANMIARDICKALARKPMGATKTHEEPHGVKIDNRKFEPE